MTAAVLCRWHARSNIAGSGEDTCRCPSAKDFLVELLALCQRYGATIGGCGCCGSPTVTIDNEYYDDLDINERRCTAGDVVLPVKPLTTITAREVV